MTIYNFQYDPRSDPNAYFAQGARNLLGGIMQGQEKGKLTDFAGSMDPEDTAMQIVAQALSRGISPQIAMGLGGLQQRGQFGPSQMMSLERWNRYQQAKAAGDKETADRLLSSALVNFNVPTSRELWGDKGRADAAEVELKDKLELSSAERTIAKKGIEDILESTPLGAARLGGWHAGIKDYEKPTIIGMYKQWLTEQGYETKTPRQKKTLDEIWDGKMNLINKMGFKFKDKDRGRLSKNEIWWDTNDPEVRRLRETGMDTTVAAPGGAQTAVAPEPSVQAEPVDQAKLDSVEKWLESKTEPKDLIDELKDAFDAIRQGAEASAVFKQVIEDFKDRPELQAFLDQVIKPFLK